MHKTVNGWTKQSMIEKIKTEFKGKSIMVKSINNISCAYRGQNGTKCAVGIFIDDSDYNPSFEGVDAASLPYFIKSKFPLDDIAIARLQAIHDCSTSAECLTDMLSWIEENVEGDV